ncbi:MAG TPA: response regulator, partial [Candidatus Angelobacter sp.]|nr:response regulator [Candidatus Angelobacter sp.]
MTAKIAAERHSAELRYFTQLRRDYGAKPLAGRSEKSRMTEGRNPIELVIIDDNPRSLEYISTALASENVKIFTASDPEEGLDLVYTHRPQVVMTDLVMPHMSGLEVLERVTE